MSLADLHGLGNVVTLAAIAAFGLAAAAVAVADRFYAGLQRLRTVLLGVIALQVLVGAGTWLSGVRPRDDLHMLYGVVLLAVLPLADNVAEDLDPRARAGILAVAAIAGLLLVWRLASTG